MKGTVLGKYDWYKSLELEVWQALSSSILDTHLHRWLSCERHKKRRMWCLHQASRQTSILCVSTQWDTVLKLQSWSPSTAECHGNHHFVGRETQESSLPHRLTLRPASLMSGETDTTQKKLTENTSTLTQTTCIVLQWIPAHTGIRGNDTVDQLAKEGRETGQPPSHLSYREVETLIRNKKKAIFHCKTGGYNPNHDALHQLPQHQQTTIFRLRTGHCRLNSHLQRTGVKISAQCPCGEVDQTPEHYLQSPAHSTTKQDKCPSKPSSGGLQRICSWHPSMRNSGEKGCRRRRARGELGFPHIHGRYNSIW